MWARLDYLLAIAGTGGKPYQTGLQHTLKHTGLRAGSKPDSETSETPPLGHW